MDSSSHIYRWLSVAGRPHDVKMQVDDRKLTGNGLTYSHCTPPAGIFAFAPFPGGAGDSLPRAPPALLPAAFFPPPPPAPSPLVVEPFLAPPLAPDDPLTPLDPLVPDLRDPDGPAAA
jgi:hypothetical protein